MGPAARDRVQKELRTHITDGGFPETIVMPPAVRIQTLQNYLDVVILRDIVERHSITNVSLIRYLIKTLICTAGGRFTVNKFFNDLKSQGVRVAKNTLHDYLEYVEDAFLAFLVPIHTESMRKRHVNPRKVYAVDPGLVRAFSLRTENLGPRFENLVYNDLRRRGCEITYHMTRSGYEVDFVARYPDGREALYQVTVDPTDEKTGHREERALEEARQELGIEGALITPESYVSDFLQECRISP
jgi:predicted AAA+ superfamily ATPase